MFLTLAAKLREIVAQTPQDCSVQLIMKTRSVSRRPLIQARKTEIKAGVSVVGVEIVEKSRAPALFAPTASSFVSRPSTSIPRREPRQMCPNPMSAIPFSHAHEIAHLKHLLAIAEERLERAQSFVFDLRCLAARKEGKGIWMRERDSSGMKAGIWDEKEALGSWILIKVSSTLNPLLSAVSPLIASTQRMLMRSYLLAASSCTGNTLFLP
jgi:hypothetical protein